MTNPNLKFESCCSIDSPVGAINIFASAGAVVHLTMGDSPVATIGNDPVLSRAANQLNAYFSGASKTLDFPVATSGTAFQEAVWAQIAKVPFGQTVSYADIAAAIGKPKASRAVGGAVGANPVPLVIGCHRVMGVSGRITGYSGGAGIPTKRWLLSHEGIASLD